MKINNKSISIAFVIILAATVIISLAGMLLMSRQPLVLQGQVEATEIRISGKLPGRVDSFLVQEGDWVKAGDTLVVINSPTIEAKYRQVNALEQVAQEQNKKIDAGTRRQIVATARQLWNKTQSDLALAKTTYQRIVTLYKDSVVTSQRRDEVEAMYKAAQAADAVLVHGTGDILLHQLHRAVTGGNVHACCGVAFRIALFHVLTLLTFWRPWDGRSGDGREYR